MLPQPSDSDSLTGRIVVTSYGGFTEQIASHFPPGMVIQLSQDEVPQKAPDTFILLPGIQLIDAAFMDQLPQLRFIQRSGAGAENIDLATAKEGGIWVANVPSVGTGNAESDTGYIGIVSAVIENIQRVVRGEVPRNLLS